MEKIIKKYWKIILIATIVIFFLVPFDMIINKSAIMDTQAEYLKMAEEQDSDEIKEIADQYLNIAIQSKLYSNINILILLIFPVLLSARLMKDIKGSKPTKELFLGQFIFIITPYVINAIVLILIKLIGGFGDYLSIIDILIWLGIGVVIGSLISAISDFVGCFSKNMFTHILSVYGFLFLPVILILGFEKLLQAIVFGFVGYGEFVNHLITEWPGLKLFAMFSYDYGEKIYIANFNFVHVICYIAILIALSYGTYKILEKQKSYNIIPLIVIYSIVIFFTMLLIASISAVANIMLATLISLVIAGILFVICVLFLKEKNIKKLAISYGIYSAIMLVLVFIIQSNIFGFEKRIPNVEEVESAVFSTTNPSIAETIVYKERENIEYIINKQKNLVENKTTIREVDKTYYKFYIQYNLKSGEKLTRAYFLLPGYEKIYDSQEFINQRYDYIVNKNEDLVAIKVLGLYNDRVFEIELKQEMDLYKTAIDAILSDLNTYKPFRTTGEEYDLYGEKTEGLQYITIDIETETAISEEYLAYALADEKYELVKFLQKLINESSELITWENQE